MKVKKFFAWAQDWGWRNTRKVGVAAILSVVALFVSIFVGGEVRAPLQKVDEVTAAQVIVMAENNKSATFVSTSNLLFGDVKNHKAARLTTVTADEVIRKLVQKDVEVKTVTSLDDIYPIPHSALLGWLGGLLATLSMFLITFYFFLKVSRPTETDEDGGAPARASNGGIVRRDNSPEPIDYENPDTTFEDVAGCEEAVESLREMADYLKNAEKYREMGVRMPKGAVLSGPPGNGKTLVARALAGEAKVPFFTASGSEFNEIYVGAGAKRVRDLFKKVREHDSAILFIDEIDAVARKRSGGGDNGNPEVEATLNQLLTEIDGFSHKASQKNVMVIAATNRPDLLDPAVTRSGRLERKIEIPNPDRRGREKILSIHSKNKKIAATVDLSLVAARTPGFSGADMEAILNEGGLIAIQRGLSSITQDCLDQAIADIAMGKARKSALVTDHDRQVTAWHEAGHTLCAYLQPEHDDPVAVSIIPRGPAGGVTWMSASDDLFLTRKKAQSQLVTAFGGRVAEEMLLEGEHTQGASSDFQQATSIAYNMVTKYGMTSVGFQTRPDQVAYSSEVVQVEVEKLLTEAYSKAKELLESHKELFIEVVEALLQENEISYFKIEELAEAHGVKHERTMEAIPVVE